MINERKRSHILSILLTPRTGYAILILALLVISIASVAAQGTGPEYYAGDDGENLVLRHVKYPEADIIDLLPLQDSYITSSRPDQNYGQDQDFWIGYDLDRTGGGAQRPYAQWDISVVPNYAIINSAEFWFAIADSRPSGDSAMTAEVRHLLGSWNENALTWNSAAGVDYDGVSAAGTIPGSTGWQYLDVTALVKEWTSGAHFNNGLVVLGDEQVQERERGMGSRNTSTIGARPFLRISYTESNDSIKPTASVIPFPNSLIGNNQFTVNWTGQDEGGSGIDFYDVQYNADDDGLDWVNWLLHVTNTSATFTADSTKYQFRVRATDKAGNLSAWSAPEEITVDTKPPDSTVRPFIPVSVHTTTFLVEWTADDGPNGSGVQYVDIYSRQGTQAWTQWIAQTTDTSATFTATVEATYGFIAIGTDNLGNVEPFTGVAEAGVIVDINPPFVETVAFLPVIFSDGG